MRTAFQYRRDGHVGLLAEHEEAITVSTAEKRRVPDPSTALQISASTYPGRWGLGMSAHLEGAAMARDVEPFDLIYKRVTKRMLEHKNGLSADEQVWFQALIDGFQDEFKKWDGSTYEAYRKAWNTLWGNIPNLTAGAFLHIAYDLPRVIADNWRPETAPPAPDESRGEEIYLGLTHIFEVVFREAARDRRIVGVPGYTAGLAARVARSVTGSDNSFVLATQWVLYLRSVAWIHGRRLRLLAAQSPALRQQAEKNMLTSVEKALSLARKWTPLMAARLKSPKLYGPTAVAILPLAVAGFDLDGPTNLPIYALLALLAVLILLSIALVWRQRRRNREAAIFVLLFGHLTAAFTNLAAREHRSSEEFAVELGRLACAFDPTVERSEPERERRTER